MSREFPFKSSRPRLTEAQCRRIKEALERKEASKAELARRMGVSASTIKRVAEGDYIPG